MACTWDMPDGPPGKACIPGAKTALKISLAICKITILWIYGFWWILMDFHGFWWMSQNFLDLDIFGYIWIRLRMEKWMEFFFRSQDLNPPLLAHDETGRSTCQLSSATACWTNLWQLSKLLKSEEPTTSWGPAFQSCTKDPIVPGPCFTLNFIEPPRFVKKISAENFNKNRGSLCRKISPVSSLLANPKPSLVPTWIFPQVTRRSETCWTMDHWKQTGKYYGGDTPTSFSNISTSRTRYDNMPVPI